MYDKNEFFCFAGCSCGDVLRHCCTQGSPFSWGDDSRHVYGLHLPVVLFIGSVLWRRSRIDQKSQARFAGFKGSSLLLLAMLLLFASVTSEQVRYFFSSGHLRNWTVLLIELLLRIFCRTNMKRLRLLVLQLPVVQGLVYMVLLVMWAEEEVSKLVQRWTHFYELFNRRWKFLFSFLCISSLVYVGLC